MLALLSVTNIISNLEIVVVVLAGVVFVAAVVLFLCHVKPPLYVGSLSFYIDSTPNPKLLGNTKLQERRAIMWFQLTMAGKSVKQNN